MKLEQAKKILTLSGDEDLREIKRKYRKLMHQVHPDNSENAETSEAAQMLNQAYATVTKAVKKRQIKQESRTESKDKTSNWSGKENKNAYTSRPIFHNVEGFDGENIGTIEVARGKYIWTTDEEFQLFLKSIYETAKDLLNEVEHRLHHESKEQIRQTYLTSLTYLLASQYIDSDKTLTELASKDSDSFYIDAMVELDSQVSQPQVGSNLYPAGISNHRLYLRNTSGALVGYLSFKDDRLYYVVIPMFEQKIAQVKIVVTENSLKSKTRRRYSDVDLWIRIDKSKSVSALESTTLQIKDLLKQFEIELQKN